MHDRALNPIPDLVIGPGDTVLGTTKDGAAWLVDYGNRDGAPRLSEGQPLRDLIRDAQDDGLLVEDRR